MTVKEFVKLVKKSPDLSNLVQELNEKYDTNVFTIELLEYIKRS